MNKILNLCSKCDKSYLEEFAFCPQCASALEKFVLTPAPDRSGRQPSQPEAPKSSSFEPISSNIRDESLPEVSYPGNAPPNQKRPSPAQSDRADKWYLAGPNELSKPYGGVGRLVYFGWMFVLGFFNGVVPGPILSLVSMGLAVLVTASRLQNIGESRLLSLLFLVPLANLWLGYKCLTQQAGYVETKELDSAGKSVRVCLIVFAALVLLSLVASFFG